MIRVVQEILTCHRSHKIHREPGDLWLNFKMINKKNSLPCVLYGQLYIAYTFMMCVYCIAYNTRSWQFFGEIGTLSQQDHVSPTPLITQKIIRPKTHQPVCLNSKLFLINCCVVESIKSVRKKCNCHRNIVSIFY